MISEDTDFWKNRAIECEGELAYLNDTIQPQAEYHDITPTNLLTTIINYHNQNTTADKQFTVGRVTVTDPNDSLYRYTNYESTLEAINEKLVKRLGGYLHIRKENGVRYLDYLAEHTDSNTQPIRFGVNMLDFTKTFDSTDYCTVLLPLGERLEDSPIEALEAYLTVESVNQGSPYVVNEYGYNTFGWIAKVVHWDNVTKPEILLSKAQKYLTDLQFDSMELEVKAVDMHYTDRDIQDLELSSQVRVISDPHGLDRYFPITKMSIPLDNPSDTAFTIGTNVKISFTQKSNTINTETLEQISNMPSESNILKKAKQNALQLLLDETSCGYVIFEYDNNNEYMIAIDICNAQTIDASTKRWRWSQGGFGYMVRQNTEQSWPDYSDVPVAITMDGAIVADFITTGLMSADRLRGGTLQLGGGSYQNGSLKMYADGNVLIGKWDKDGIDIDRGDINLGGGKFHVDNNGNLTATSGSFKGDITGATGKFSGTVTGGDININDRFIVTSTGRVKIVTQGASASDDYLVIKDPNGKETIIGGEYMYSTGAAESVKISDLLNYYLAHR